MSRFLNQYLSLQYNLTRGGSHAICEPHLNHRSYELSWLFALTPSIKITNSGIEPILKLRLKSPNSVDLWFWKCLFIRSEKSQNESSPNFSNFCPGFCPEFLSEFSPNFWRSFCASFRGKQRPEKIHQKSPHFSMQNSQANAKKYSQNFSGEDAK